MRILLILILLVQVANLVAIKMSQWEIQMTIQELEAAVGALGDQLDKALAEILAEIQTLGTVPQSLVDKVTRAQSIAQQLDDINPDTGAK